MGFKKPLFHLLLVLASFFTVGCREEEVMETDVSEVVAEKTIAIVLPMENGLNLHWNRCVTLYLRNLERAYRNHDKKIKLNLEIYDEMTDNLEDLAISLGRREDVYAVVGGLYSSNAAILTTHLSRVGKTLFTLATSEELVRAYASTGHLWAMTETDITQCEVLLSKVVNYGGKSVALIARGNDIYGKTFLDWFAFQAKELGLKNSGVYSFTDDTLEAAMENAVKSGAEYLICVPSDTGDTRKMLSVYHQAESDEDISGVLPRMLFSDTAYGTDVLSALGDEAEGIEGVAFGSDPESGFDVSYKTYFGMSPTTGEAQLYDALMLLGYAAWYQYLHPDTSLQVALRELVSGEDVNMGSWAGEDMSLVIDALERGDAPYIRGASGKLRFDKKIFTNVLSTTYYNYRVYNHQYIILDYNSSDGGNRTDATLAGWNWKISQMQEFENQGSASYGPHTGSWALLIAGSSGWENYRHQADVLAIYQQLRSNGFPDERIILIMEDDLAYNPSNPDEGVLKIAPGDQNVYENVEIDYQLSRLTPEDFLSILSGEKSERTPQVIESEGGDNIFVFWSGHGIPGSMYWNENPYGITGEKLKKTLLQMAEKASYRKLLMMTEACYSGGVMQACEGIPGMLFITAANGEETSKADIFSGELKVWMSNRFTSTFIQQIRENPTVSLRDLYYRLFINTVGSHVMVYNAHNFGNIYSSDISEFIIY